MVRSIAILLVAGHGAYRDALSALLARDISVNAVQVTGSATEALAFAAQQAPDLIVVDSYRLPDWKDLCQSLHSVSDRSKLAVLHSKVTDRLGAPPNVPVTQLYKSMRASSLVKALVEEAAQS